MGDAESEVLKMRSKKCKVGIEQGECGILRMKGENVR